MQHEREEQQRQEIAVIQKSQKHQIHVSLATFRGRTFGDLRLYVLKDGNFIPTQKGCTVGIDQLEELEHAVLKLRNAAEQSALISKVTGWLPPA